MSFLGVVVTSFSVCLIIFLYTGILVLPAGLLGEKRNYDTLVEVVVEMECGVSDWVGGTDSTQTCIVTQKLVRRVNLVLVM